MSEGRNNTPAWIGQLVAALLTVGATWTAIRTEVPSIVRQELHAELATQAMHMQHRQDSAWKAMADTMHNRIQAEAYSVAEELRATLYLVQQRPDRVTYSPTIAVPPDTAGTVMLMAKLDTLQQWQRSILRQLAVLSTPRGTPPTSKPGPWSY